MLSLETDRTFSIFIDGLANLSLLTRSYAYTGGCDSLVRIWRTESGIDEEPDTALDAEDPITALATDVRIPQTIHVSCLTKTLPE